MKIKVLCVAMFFCCIGVTSQEVISQEVISYEVEQNFIDSIDSNKTESIKPSRSVELKKRQNLNVDYPGNGWIYLGETDGSLLLRYSGRKLSETKTSFTLTAQGEGEAILHFYKNDALTGNYIEDYLFVKIQGESEVASSVTAPSYADIVPPHPIFDKESTIQLASDTDSTKTLQTDLDTKSNTSSNKDTSEAKVSSKKEESPSPKVASASKKEDNTAKKVEPAKKEQTSTKEAITKQEEKQVAKVSATQNKSSDKSETIIQDTKVLNSAKSEITSNEITSKEVTSNEVTSTKKQTSVTPTKSKTQSSNYNELASNANNKASSLDIPATKKAQEPLPSASKTSSTAEVNKNTTATKANSSEADKLLALAQEAYNSKDYEKTLSYLADFLEQSVDNIDEGIFLQGQALEAPSKSRNIKLSLEAYKKLVEEYPQSSKWDKAHERIIYIERLYFNIR